MSFSEDFSFEHCRTHPNGDKLKRKSGAKLYRIISQPCWRVAGRFFRESNDFGQAILDAGEYLPSAKWIEQWRQENRPHFVYENTLPQSFGASEKARPLNDNQRVLDAVMKKNSSKYDEWYLNYFSTFQFYKGMSI